MQKVGEFIKSHKKISYAFLFLVVSVGTTLLISRLIWSWKDNTLDLFLLMLVLSILIWIKEFCDRKYLEWAGSIILVLVFSYLFFLLIKNPDPIGSVSFFRLI